MKADFIPDETIKELEDQRFFGLQRDGSHDKACMGRYHGLKAVIQNNPGEPESDPSLEWNPLSRATCLELGRQKNYLTFFHHCEFPLYENFTGG